MIEFRRVTKMVGSAETSVRAVNEFSFDCPKGAFWAIMGPSGSGKSTILHLIAGLTLATSGTVLVDGRDVAKMRQRELAALRRRQVGYVMQAFNLLPFLTVEENVALPLELDGLKEKEVQTRTQEALSLANIGHRAAHAPAHLSGGEQQRVAIARALVTRPAILLADEPTGNLDHANGRAIIDLIQDLNESTGLTVLLVTHDPVLAAASNRVLRLLDGALEHDQHLTHTDPPEVGDLGIA